MGEWEEKAVPHGLTDPCNHAMTSRSIANMPIYVCVRVRVCVYVNAGQS